VTAAPAFDFSAWAAAHRAALDPLLVGVFDGVWPERLRLACRYPIETGGKRFRPLAVLAAAEALGGPAPQGAWVGGVALELIHTYSLVHDDLPAMDNDDLRRGRPTVHRAFDEGTAILVGDALLTEALGHVARAGLPPQLAGALLVELAGAAGARGMIAGQAADVGMDGAITEVDALLRLHAHKTGALIRCAARIGGLAAGATDVQLAALDRYGAAIGLAFQLADDVLDADQDAKEGGPPSYVKLLGVDETQRRARALLDEALEAAGTLPAPAALQALGRYTVEREL
jgi:farnesyl diphosphate synthase/geranylgeranyl diphosphate synthase type II